MSARVRLAQARDAEAVADLLIAFRDHMGKDWPAAETFLAGVVRLMDDDDTEYLLGFADEHSPPQGVVQLRFRDGIWRAGPDCLVEDVFVREEARGSGLGRALVAAAVDRATARGARRMELDVNEANPAAVALYESFGFSATDTPYAGRDLYMRVHLDAGPDGAGTTNAPG